MLLLPVAGSFGIRLIPEIILVLRLGQPRPLQRAFPGLAAVRLEAIALACSTPVIGKKKTLAVQALPAGLGRLHRSQSQTEPSAERQGNQRKKIQPQEQSKRRRRKKNFQRILGRKSTGRRSILNRRFCIYSISPLARVGPFSHYGALEPSRRPGAAGGNRTVAQGWFGASQRAQRAALEAAARGSHVRRKPHISTNSPEKGANWS